MTIIWLHNTNAYKYDALSSINQILLLIILIISLLLIPYISNLISNSFDLNYIFNSIDSFNILS